MAVCEGVNAFFSLNYVYRKTVIFCRLGTKLTMEHIDSIISVRLRR